MELVGDEKGRDVPGIDTNAVVADEKIEMAAGNDPFDLLAFPGNSTEQHRKIYRQFRQEKPPRTIGRGIVLKLDEPAGREFPLQCSEGIAAGGDGYFMAVRKKGPDNRDIPHGMAKAPVQGRKQHGSHLAGPHHSRVIPLLLYQGFASGMERKKKLLLIIMV
jgi:hypothetical protein